MKRPYMVLSTSIDSYERIGFMTAFRHHYETLQEAEKAVENYIEAYKAHNLTKQVYRIKNKETGEIIKEYL